ncbi:hypothetical protein ACIRD0_37310 [Streptomyces microflavus]|uniref:hypothetical protein n=1 Tax=Streptomyces microflavus TaxID=1919 RepID=UPI00381FA832
MNGRTAADQLAAALEELRQKAEASYSWIGERGRQQGVKLNQSKLSSWFRGISVPEKGEPFEVLIQLLEERAFRKRRTLRRGVPYWDGMRAAAARRQRGSAASTPPINGRKQDDLVVGLVGQVEEFMLEADRVFIAVARYETEPPVYATQRVTDGHGWFFDVPVRPTEAASDPKDVEALSELDGALVGVRTDAKRAATLMPHLDIYVTDVLTACNDIRRSCVYIHIDDEGRPDSDYPARLQDLKRALGAFKEAAATAP